MNLVECERLDDLGRGIAYIDGKIVFISNLLPTEEAYVEIIQEKKKYSIGKVIKLVKKSKYRCNDKNTDYSDLSHLKYENQLEYKEKKLTNIFKKFGIKIKINPIIKGKNIWNYRNKVTLKVEEKCGYYKNSSHDFLPINFHPLANKNINKIIDIISKENLSNVKEIIIKSYDESMVIIKGTMNISKLKKQVQSIYVNEKCIYGNNYVQAHIDNLKFLVGPESFFQVNSEVTTKLYNEVLKNINKEDENILDLYCGAGTISLFLAKKAKRVLGIEINKEAIKCANLNKKLNNIENVDFICGDVSKEIHKIKSKTDVIVVDPPRAGLTKEGIDDILKINPPKIIYVSCDPITLARDIALLKNYEANSSTPFDMFPQTHHVECVSVLHRKSLKK
ncbi:MAG: 23S rRNA (uracil(1939)-C(5))-methyltransferase RlmD [Bacilli bacterium]|nr:23S rRNA (uracil(1939)-C(5))-methyltransferase RlmD [Bacilli bacterium]